MYLYLLQVLSDMTLILLSVVGNLFVLNSLREKEALLAITQNLVRPSFCSFMLTMKRGWGSRLTAIFQVLLNICFANLVSAIFIKSISIVHNGFDQPPICLTKIKRKFMSISFKEFISSLKEYTIVPFMYIVRSLYRDQFTFEGMLWLWGRQSPRLPSVWSTPLATGYFLYCFISLPEVGAKLNVNYISRYTIV